MGSLAPSSGQPKEAAEAQPPCARRADRVAQELGVVQKSESARWTTRLHDHLSTQ